MLTIPVASSYKKMQYFQLLNSLLVLIVLVQRATHCLQQGKENTYIDSRPLPHGTSLRLRYLMRRWTVVAAESLTLGSSG